MLTEWDRRFLDLAKHVAQWSKDPSTKVGAVITDNNRIISVGFNGFPRRVRDDGRLQDRQTKYEITVHAEANALLFARGPVVGMTIYTWPVPPCSRCAALIIQAGIARVVSVTPPDHWQENCRLAEELFLEAGVRISVHDPKLL